MDQHPHPPPPAARAHWTPARQRIFLAALMEIGRVAAAARAAGMSRASAHRLRRRVAGTPFDRGWAHVLGLHARRLADPFAPDAAPSPARRAPVAPAPRP